nr:MAG TPA: Prokaryotic membrane lipoprotein lipid attachment site [Caudoviricetes sp.]
MKRIILLGIVVLLLCSCGAARVQTQTIYVRDTTYISKVQVDSVYKRDSVFVKEKGDTIYRYVERYRDRYKFLRDTIYRYKVDSVYVDKERVVKVEKELTAWQRFRLRGFWVLAAAVAAIGFWKFRRPILGLLTKLIS